MVVVVMIFVVGGVKMFCGEREKDVDVNLCDLFAAYPTSGCSYVRYSSLEDVRPQELGFGVGERRKKSEEEEEEEEGSGGRYEFSRVSILQVFGHENALHCRPPSATKKKKKKTTTTTVHNHPSTYLVLLCHCRILLTSDRKVERVFDTL
ncbi:hypothetical protein M0804_001330 [Polistes exclamans]|nr:hypothetical protein M0804_001330 [Polistes exclamans]